MGQQVEKSDVVIKRLFRNKDGDWKKLESKIKEMNAYGDVIQSLIEDLVKAEAKLKILSLEAYHLAPKTDCLFYDSPVSPDKQTLAIKLYFKKLGWSGIRDVWMDAPSIQLFSETVKDSCRWLLKFKNDKD